MTSLKDATVQGRNFEIMWAIKSPVARVQAILLWRVVAMKLHFHWACLCQSQCMRETTSNFIEVDSILAELEAMISTIKQQICL